MPKDTFLKIRLDPTDMLNLERHAGLLNMPKSRFARLMLTGGAAPPQQNQQNHQQPQSSPIDDSRFARLEADVAEMRDALTKSADAFNALLQSLTELHRVPTFREYRGRMAAEGVEKRQNETDEQYLIRLGMRYFVAFRVWPDPADSRSFGPIPAGVNFPKTPPAS